MMNARDIPVEQSVGLTLAYDLTGITPGKEKGAVLRRGHVITASDLELLRDIGKSHIKVLELAPDDVHEDDAAEQLALMFAGRGISVALPGEAWADLIASTTGLLKIAKDRLRRVNLLSGPGKRWARPKYGVSWFGRLCSTRRDTLPLGPPRSWRCCPTAWCAAEP
jgi:hypothetical protein